MKKAIRILTTSILNPHLERRYRNTNLDQHACMFKLCICIALTFCVIDFVTEVLEDRPNSLKQATLVLTVALLMLLLLSWATRSFNESGAHVATLGFFLCFGIPGDHVDEALATRLYLQGVTISLLFSVLHNHSWIASSVVCIVGSAVFWTFQSAIGIKLSPSSLATIVMVVTTHLVVVFISSREKRVA